MVDNDAVADAVRNLLRGIGEDPTREGLEGTPRRISEMYREIFAGMDQDPYEILSVGFEEGHEEMVIVRDIPFFSMCEHHLLPFHGVAHVGYIPKGRVVGISKLARAVDIFAKRPQVQERLTSQIADAIMDVIKPRGVAVIMEAEHLCMTMRGVKKPGSKVVTSANRGIFRSNQTTRNEFMSIITGVPGARV
ncbi:MAG: GTP cyclohydrolase I FolE [Actinobacteria bacterium]|nr:GTP cyclohydrolase I FolE [Actinomycetota bacterium]